MRKLRTNRWKMGYTMGELLATVAILMILAAIAVPATFTIQRNLRQKTLDNKAEIIYTAVQNNLTKLRSSGNSSSYAASKATLLSTTPIDIDSNGKETLYYVVSDNKTDADNAASVLVTSDTVDAELYSHYWVVEYDPSSASVYSVFYSESRDDYSPSSYNKLRYKKNRLSDGAKVGYYGGDSVESDDTTALVPKITINNEEKLQVVITSKRPDENPLSFDVELSDTEGHTVTLKYGTDSTKSKLVHKQDDLHLANSGTLDDNESGQIRGSKYTLTITLDALNTDDEEGSRFAEIYGEGNSLLKNTKKCLTPGTTLNIKVTAHSDSPLVDGLSATATTNSLFGDESTNNEAEILYGRHLQNLDEDSLVTKKITSAVQRSDIDFQKKGDSASDTAEDISSWYSCYKDLEFQSITNENLTNYRGDADSEEQMGQESTLCVISHLTTEIGNKSGLFAESADGMTISNVALSGASINGDATNKSYAGGFVAYANGSLTLENCQLYLDESDIEDKTDADLWIQDAATEGGLVGHADGKVTIKNSLASTVMGGTNSSLLGGLVGEAAGGADIESSYADSYISGEQVGGLIAKADGETSVNASYSVGYLTTSKIAGGFIAGGSGSVSMTNSYTAVSWWIAADSAEDTDVVRYSTAPAESVSGCSNTFFLQGGTDYSDSTESAVGTKIDYTSLSNVTKMSASLNNGGIYFTNAVTTNAYNLKDQGLAGYSYPEIVGLTHYGDWQANFEAGSLVYYEVYKDSDGTISYGFYGGNITPSLRNDLTIVGDGYGIVYNKNEKPTGTFSIMYYVNENGDVKEETQNFDPDGTNYSVIVGGFAYLIYPFPAEIVNAEPIGSDFYQKVTVQGASAVGESDSDSEDVNVDGNVFYYNPHFAKTVISASEDGQVITTPSTISIRSARQLYSLSKFYDDYAMTTRKSTFTQELDINYEQYDWMAYTTETETVSVQSPIGEKERFTSTYNGGYHVVDGISFASDDNRVGLFGENSGTIQNVFLTSDYIKDSESNSYLSYNGEIKNNRTIYMGALAGINNGRIINCAASGFYLGSSHTMYVNQNGTLYFGGLVGSNRGTVRNSEADTPFANANVLYGRAYIGGFAGQNTSQGSITNCYSIGKLGVEYSKGENSDVSGFVARNAGTISGSYCAVTMTAAGSTTTYAFAKRGGNIVNCTYLGGGTLSYLGTMDAFDNTSGAGSMNTYKEMQIENRSQAKCHSATSTNADASYPFRTVVTDSAGQGVHFGNWQYAVNLGKFGVIYWEKEESGSNNGYHFAYIGYKNADGDIQKVNGNTLCEEHDDGGIITEYGYAYYYDSNASYAPVMTADGFQTGEENKEASEALSSRLEGFKVVAYTTAPAIQKTADDTASYMKMTSGNENGVWTLTDSNDTNVEYSFTINPFFADALQYGTDSSEYPMPGDDGNKYQIRSAEQLQYINWNNATGNAITTLDSDNYTDYVNFYTYLGQTVDNAGKVDGGGSTYIWTGDSSPELQKYTYSSTCSYSGFYDCYLSVTTNTEYWEFVEEEYPGYSKNYEIKTWSSESYYHPRTWGKRSTTHTHYTYTETEKTGYWKWVGSGKPTSGSWKEISSDVVITDGKLSFIQSHDVDANMTPNGNTLFTQIGSLFDEYGKDSNKETKVYTAYFTGSYDGNTYSIKNIEINSCNTLIGLFGAVVGGDVQNVTLYSDKGNYIQRTETSTASKSWYAIGGLCGLAGTGTGDGATYSTITNCTVSGYTIRDNSNYSSWGDGNIGGMFGISTMNISQCSAVNTIVLNTEFPSSGDGCKSDGVSLRTGGLVGSMRGTLTNSYTGGEVVITDRCYTNAQYGYGSKIFLGGLTGGIYLKSDGNLGTMLGDNIQGFSNFTRDDNGSGTCNTPTQTIKNCYTYIKLPGSNSTDRAKIKAIAPIGSNGETPNERSAGSNDGTNRHVRVEIVNCYYYEDSMPEAKYYTYYGSSENIDMTAVGLSWEEMQSELFDNLSNAGFSAVTSQENGQSVNGKYTFPGNNTSLDGENYPFPTILTQTKSDGSKVNIHYGEWPNSYIYWTESRASMNIFESLDFDPDSPYNGKSIRKFVLKNSDKCELSTDLTFDDFAFSYGSTSEDPSSDTEPIAEVVDISYDSEQGGYVATVQANKDGTETITATAEGYSATFSLTVTADLTTSASKISMAMENGSESALQLYVFPGSIQLSEETEEETGDRVVVIPDGLTNLATDANMAWEEITMDNDGDDFLTVKKPVNGEFTVACGADLGDVEIKLTITGTYTYNGNAYSVTTWVYVHGTETETPAVTSVDETDEANDDADLTNAEEQKVEDAEGDPDSNTIQTPSEEENKSDKLGDSANKDEIKDENQEGEPPSTEDPMAQDAEGADETTSQTEDPGKEEIANAETLPDATVSNEMPLAEEAQVVDNAQLDDGENKE